MGVRQYGIWYNIFILTILFLVLRINETNLFQLITEMISVEGFREGFTFWDIVQKKC